MDPVHHAMDTGPAWCLPLISGVAPQWAVRPEQNPLIDTSPPKGGSSNQSGRVCAVVRRYQCPSDTRTMRPPPGLPYNHASRPPASHHQVWSPTPSYSSPLSFRSVRRPSSPAAVGRQRLVIDRLLVIPGAEERAPRLFPHGRDSYRNTCGIDRQMRGCAFRNHHTNAHRRTPTKLAGPSQF